MTNSNEENSIDFENMHKNRIKRWRTHSNSTINDIPDLMFCNILSYFNPSTLFLKYSNIDKRTTLSCASAIKSTIRTNVIVDLNDPLMTKKGSYSNPFGPFLTSITDLTLKTQLCSSAGLQKNRDFILLFKNLKDLHILHDERKCEDEYSDFIECKWNYNGQRFFGGILKEISSLQNLYMKYGEEEDHYTDHFKRSTEDMNNIEINWFFDPKVEIAHLEDMLNITHDI